MDMDIYDITYLMASNALKEAKRRKDRLEKQFYDIQAELETQKISIQEFEKKVKILESKTRLTY